ncbi:MAG: peptide ABC transporter substrate-binding protein [Clostridia bacterium]|nr:peptide ABC transporter substrate-binding protein [Clostridia bacterium]
MGLMNSMRIKRAVIMIIISAILTVFLGGCGKKEPEQTQAYPPRVAEREGGIFRFQLANDPSSLDPARFDFQDSSSRQLMYLLYDGLVDFHSQTMEVIPSLSSNWQISEDGKTYRFYLQEGIKFHNGKEVTAEVFKESWERLLSPGKKYANSFLLQGIVGAKDLQAGKAEEAKGIKVIAPYTLQVELEEPNSAFLSILGHPATFPVDLSVAEKAGDKYGSDKALVVGTGPFRIVEWQRNKQLTLEQNPGYFGHISYIERLEMPIVKDSEEALIMLEAGKLHFIQEIPAGKMSYVDNNPELADLIVKEPFLATYYYAFNLTEPPFDNVKIRQALNYAINRELIIEYLWEGLGEPLGGIVPVGFNQYGYPKNGYTYNLAVAKKLLEDTGHPLGFGIPDVVLTYNSSAGHRAIARAVQQQLAQIGIKAILEEVSWEELLTKMQQGDGNIFRMGWIADYPHVDNFLYNSFYSGAINKGNIMNYTNNLVDDLLKQARAERDIAKSMELYSLAESYLIADAPMLWLFSYQKGAMQGDYVRGLKLNALGVVPLEQVWIEKTSW